MKMRMRGSERVLHQLSANSATPEHYIHRHEMDRSLNHTVGKAGFIRDSAKMHQADLPKFVERHMEEGRRKIKCAAILMSPKWTKKTI